MIGRYGIIKSLLIVFILGILFFHPGNLSIYYLEVSAENKEYNIEKIDHKMVIPFNSYKSIDINFEEGKELEVIFNLQVKNNLPIDLWFVNDDNFLLLSSGSQFLYFIDGSDRQQSYARRIVTLNEYDNYKMVMTNYYANQSVEVDISLELRTYSKSSEKSEFSWTLAYIIIVSIITSIFIIFLALKRLRGRRVIGKNTIKESPKINKKMVKNHKNRNSLKRNNSKKTKSEKKNNTKSNQKNPGSSKKSIEAANFCGYCGKKVDTPYCKNCGEKL
jgi:hypothetical protein